VVIGWEDGILLVEERRRVEGGVQRKTAYFLFLADFGFRYGQEDTPFRFGKGSNLLGLAKWKKRKREPFCYCLSPPRTGPLAD